MWSVVRLFVVCYSCSMSLGVLLLFSFFSDRSVTLPTLEVPFRFVFLIILNIVSCIVYYFAFFHTFVTIMT